MSVRVGATDNTRPEIATARLDSDLAQTKPFLADVRELAKHRG